MKKINTYSASELQKEFPDGFTHAHNEWIDSVSSDGIFWQDEIMDSLKAMFKHSGITLNDWSISDSSPSWVKFELFESEYTNKKAMDWIRYFYDLKTIKLVNYKYDGKKYHRYDITPKDSTKSDWYLTGYCADYDFMKSLLDDIKSGYTLSEAYHNLADCAGKVFYAEYVDQTSEEYFIDHADANDYEYTENGIQV